METVEASLAQGQKVGQGQSWDLTMILWYQAYALNQRSHFSLPYPRKETWQVLFCSFPGAKNGAHDHEVT